MMEAKIKTWKVSEIISAMSKYGDRYDVTVKGHTYGEHIFKCADENDFVIVTNIMEIIKETEKAVNISIDGFKTWVPKSAIIF